MSEAHSESVATQGVLPRCRECGGAIERLRRHGFIQHKLMPLFGRYPWRCVLCNDITYRTARNARQLRRQHGVPDP